MIRRLSFLVLILALAAGGIYFYRTINRPQGLMLTGIVTTHEVYISPQIQGRMSQLLVKEGDTVKAGQLVAVIDPQELKADRLFYARTEQGAAAQVEEDEAALKYQETLTRDQIRQAEAALTAAEAQAKEVLAEMELDRVNLERSESLFKKQVLSARLWIRRAPPTKRARHARNRCAGWSMPRVLPWLWPVPMRIRSLSV